MKYLLSIVIVITSCSIQAQSFVGFLSDNYSGVHGAIINPANSVDSRYVIDINIGGVSGALTNDYYSLQLSDLFKDKFDFQKTNQEFEKSEVNMMANADIMGPSILFNINEKHAIAVVSRARLFYNLSDISVPTFEIFSNNFESTEDLDINEGDFSITGNAWAEIGVSYAAVLLNNNQHFLKGGVTLKYLQGLGNLYSSGNNITLNYDADGTALPDGGTTGSIASDGELSYGYSKNVEEGFGDFDLVSGATGFGGDIGFIYEWRPDHKSYSDTDRIYGYKTPYRNRNKYKLKFGLSITDFGSITYKNGIEEIYDITTTVNQDTYESIADFEDRLDLFYTVTDTANTSKVTLPTALHANVDWNLNDKFYINLNTDISLTTPKNKNTTSITNAITATFRYESKWFSAYSPVSMFQSSGVQWGAGFRFGPVYAGSGSILSLLLNDNAKVADFYVGLKIPIYQSPPKDTDKDGVLDKDDECPEVRGPRNNKGCKWPDSDNDGVLDKDDQCPEIYGAPSNGGCPIKAIDKTIQKELNAYARTILFDYAKATLKEDSQIVLDEIVNILNEYPDTKFVIEGHTDSLGSNILNLKMSQNRANSVQDYLIEKGIDSARLTAKGYGEEQPITTNKTKKGRAENRRVEINLVK